MTTFLLALYVSGLAFMLVGLTMAPQTERRGAMLLPTVMAYLFWPLSLLIVIGFIAHERFSGLNNDRVASEHAYN